MILLKENKRTGRLLEYCGKHLYSSIRIVFEETIPFESAKIKKKENIN